jgi:hypothetical protein
VYIYCCYSDMLFTFLFESIASTNAMYYIYQVYMWVFSQLTCSAMWVSEWVSKWATIQICIIETRQKWSTSDYDYEAIAKPEQTCLDAWTTPKESQPAPWTIGKQHGSSYALFPVPLDQRHGCKHAICTSFQDLPWSSPFYVMWCDGWGSFL